MRKILLLAALLLLAGCSQFQYAPPPPTPQAITAIISPSLAWLRDHLNQCASEIPELALFVDLRTRLTPNVQAGEVLFWLGPPPEGFQGAATRLGDEQIVVIASTDIPASQLDLASIQDSYTSLEPPYYAWTYPAGNALRQSFEATVLNGASTTPHVLLAPDPAALLEAVKGENATIGYISRSWLSGEVQTVPLPEAQQEALLQPVLGLTMEQPEGLARELLFCLGNSFP
jgi:DNA-binding transcriptional LysR family regulator